MKNAAWHQKHFADADRALDAAAELLAEARTSMERINVGNKTALADSFINLARAHHRAIEADVATRGT